MTVPMDEAMALLKQRITAIVREVTLARYTLMLIGEVAGHC